MALWVDDKAVARNAHGKAAAKRRTMPHFIRAVGPGRHLRPRIAFPWRPAPPGQSGGAPLSLPGTSCTAAHAGRVSAALPGQPWCRCAPSAPAFRLSSASFRLCPPTITPWFCKITTLQPFLKACSMLWPSALEPGRRYPGRADPADLRLDAGQHAQRQGPFLRRYTPPAPWNGHAARSLGRGALSAPPHGTAYRRIPSNANHRAVAQHMQNIPRKRALVDGRRGYP